MLHAVSDSPVLGLADTSRPVFLIVFILLLFALAGLALFFGKRQIAAQQARALSNDTGVLKGAMRGSDTTFDDNWLAATRAEDDGDKPKQSWKDAILGPGALHDDTSDEHAGEVLAPEIRFQRESAAATQQEAWDAPQGESEWTSNAPAWTLTYEDDGLPAPTPDYLQPEQFPAEHAQQGRHVEGYAQPQQVTSDAPRHRSHTNQPATTEPFLVDSGLDDED